MIDKFSADEWKIIEEGFDPHFNKLSESIFSLGNGHMGLRGFFEEGYSGESLQGTYVAGIYYPDKTRVGWWKIGYPEFFAKVINSINWIGVDIEIDGIRLDLAKCCAKDFRRELDMEHGILKRTFTWVSSDGKETSFVFTRFLSAINNNIACVSIIATPLNYSGRFSFVPYLNGDVSNEDSNFGDTFWEEVNRSINPDEALLAMKTKKTGFLLTTAMSVRMLVDKEDSAVEKHLLETEKFVGYRMNLQVEKGKAVELQKTVSVCTSRDFEEIVLEKTVRDLLREAFRKGFNELLKQHCREMEKKWEDNDVVIKGDIKAQQGIRYNIFQLNQTYNGKDPRLNIGPKGFTGEKYGGGTYWDTEAFCFPFYLYTNESVARNLLYYRYLHLEKARENAAKLGFRGALYPMATMDGQECHNEWEITFEEIHRNGAVAYAIYNYTGYTGDCSYLMDYGIEVLVEVSRFWADRAIYNKGKGKYMILGVTGPNEYENNVNNNWYTNMIAAWTLEYTLASFEQIKHLNERMYNEKVLKLNVNREEMSVWKNISDNMYYPYVKELDIFEQNDLYMDKEQLPVKDLPKEILPLNKHWSWDRILRSCFIKQADVIQGIYFFPERFDIECIRRNFDFYEQRTVHESSLSPSVHSIVASWLDYREKAYELYLRTARLDLDNYNDDTEDGIHLTSMAGSWNTIIQGFAGIRTVCGKLTMRPYIPANWEEYSFKITFRGRKLKISISGNGITVGQMSGESLPIVIFDREYTSCADKHITIPIQ